MALNNSTLARNATRFKQLILRASKFGSDPINFGTRPDRVALTVYTVPGQTSNIMEIRDLSENVLNGFDASGNNTVGGYVSIALTAANLKALVGTPITLIAAPGANKYIEVYSAIFFFVYGTVQYTGGHTNGLNVFVKASTGMTLFTLDTTKIASATASRVFNLANNLGAGSQDDANTNAVNQAIVLQGATTDLATGDGTGFLHLRYKVHTVTA